LPERKTRFLNLISFKDAYQLQKKILAERIQGVCSDTTLGLIHKPCITVGRMEKRSEISEDKRLPVYFIERGGRVTYHGPGQLVVYFIWNIKKFGIKGFLDLLEETVVNTLKNMGVKEENIRRNVNGRGVWLKNKKIASIGVAIKKWVSYHGLSINIDKRIHQGFDRISPCGMSSREICCLEHFDIKVTPEEVFRILTSILLT